MASVFSPNYLLNTKALIYSYKGETGIQVFSLLIQCTEMRADFEKQTPDHTIYSYTNVITLWRKRTHFYGNYELVTTEAVMYKYMLG
jgi:hypothetical protein